MNGTLKISCYGKSIHIRNDVMCRSEFEFRTGDLSFRVLVRDYTFCIAAV